MKRVTNSGEDGVKGGNERRRVAEKCRVVKIREDERRMCCSAFSSKKKGKEKLKKGRERRYRWRRKDGK